MKKIGYLGMGAWGYALTCLLALKRDHRLVCWTTNPELATSFNATKRHSRFPGHKAHGHITLTTSLEEAVAGADILIESVTSAGVRSVCEQIRHIGIPQCPLILTSKGIEQNTGKILPEVAIEVLGESMRRHVGILSGPSFAEEVVQGFPTSVVGSGYSTETIHNLCQTFNSPRFRVYPNHDILGVAFGGALKNVIAIACGIADGLLLGNSAKAALMTRGLHEMRKLAVAAGCRSETIHGLSGMGDLCLTCHSSMSRNFRYGHLIAQGKTPTEASAEIGMVIEGAYTVVSALQLGKEHKVELPIARAVHAILSETMTPLDAVRMLMQRTIKEEHL